ncbi:conserved Plasmodium protein, unknown function [Plasmodium gallinaceum]|uniref:Metallo-beta-lactamase domain-containing protein n=1 Tax=Plasmodium gallinaceum TaxID=5849 RepID=A0A1J1GYV7_PLAGA|nr:conserved Plasmodium protein, unknown function [Plasmodium gallinaceum]CRG96488.1 conserved Plasmodium protein, unknown function [Plasmodium gallinaceum]
MAENKIKKKSMHYKNNELKRISKINKNISDMNFKGKEYFYRTNNKYIDDNYIDVLKKKCMKEKQKYFLFFPPFLNKTLKKKEKHTINIIIFMSFFLIFYIILKNYSYSWKNENNITNSFDSYFENDEYIYIPNKKTSNTIHLKNILGTEIVDNNFLSIYSESMKYLRQTSLNFSLRQRSLSTECYVYFKSFLKQAISPHSLTKAIKIDKEYIYPWDSITQDEVSKIFENAKFFGFLVTWFKNHRKAQNVSQEFLKREMPVLSPRFIQRADLYTHFYKNNDEMEPNFYGVNYTWLGHATGLVVVDGFKVLLDPVFNIELLSLKGIARSLLNWANVKIMGGLGARISKSPCNISDLPDDLHAVFVSHNHHDHIMEEDVRVLCKLKKFQNVMWYVPEGLANFFLKEGCKAAKIYELSWGDERWISCWISYKQFQCRDGIWKSKNNANSIFKYKIIYAPTLHWTARKDNLSDFNQSLWGSLILKGPKHKFYFSGDTAYLKDDFEEFKKIGRLHGPFHLAAISIGAYEPNDHLKYHHVHPWESVKIWRDIRAEIAVGIHWGTFRLSAEEFMQPRDDLEAALLGVSFYTLRNISLPEKKKKIKKIMKKYYIKNNNEKKKENDDLEDLKEYFYPSSNDEYHEYTESFHSIFSDNLNLFYSDINRNYVKHMYQQKKLYASTYKRFKRALILRNSKKLPKSWKKLLLNLSIRFQTIPIGGSIEVNSKNENISMTRSSEYNSTLYEHYTFPHWYKSKENEEVPNQNSFMYEDLMNFHIVS